MLGNKKMIKPIGCTKYPLKIPEYAYIVETQDDIWEEKPGTRYPIYWKLGESNLYSTVDANVDNRVIFENIDIWGGLKRVFINTAQEDGLGEAFAYVYCKSTKELQIIALSAREARFGGIVIEPMNSSSRFKVYRHNHLMNKWRRLTPLIGKWAILLRLLHDEIIYRPGNSGAKRVAKDFELCNKKIR